MAKSIRSKWKRKCRAVKRERYAVKELARLKKMLGIKEEEKKDESEVMEPEADQVIFLDAGEIAKKGKKKKEQKKIPDPDPEDVEMSSDDERIEVDNDKGKKRVFSSKTMKDQNGQYPIWLHKRKIAKMTSAGKKNGKKRLKKRRR